MESRLRVGIVCPYSFEGHGGVQNQVLGFAGWLRSAGHEVHILAPGRPNSGVLARHGVTASDFTSSGGSFPIPYNGSVARVSFGPTPSLAVRRWLTSHDLDVVHLHEPITPSIAIHALWQAEVPIVATFHTATPGSRGLRWAGRTLPHTISRIDAATSASWVAHDVALNHLRADSVVVGNGIRLADHALAPCIANWRGGEQPRITFIGRYAEHRKGFEVLVAALPAIRAAHPGAIISVVGEGPARAVPGVEFLGQLDDAARDELLTRTDVYVAPNLGRESFGVILLEALASGAPVVASDITAFRDVISDAEGPVGRLFPVGDHRALAREVAASLAEPRDLHLIRSRAVAAQFDWDRIGPQLLLQYRRAIERSGASVSER